MRFAVCAAEDVRRDILTIIRRLCAQQSLSFSYRQYSSAEELLYDIEDGDYPTLVFLEADRDLASLRALRNLGYKGDVILISNTADMAVEGYTFYALDYWLLPLDHGQVYERLRTLTMTAHPVCLTVKQHGAVIRVPYSAIVFAESRNSKCIVHRVGGDELVVYCKLNTIEQQLADERFLRCHQSYLVNMDHVVCAQRHFVMDDGRIVAIRQRELHRMRERYRIYAEARQRLWNMRTDLLCDR